MSTKGKSSGFYKKPPKSQTAKGDILLPKRTKGQEIPLTTVGGTGSITEALETLMTRLLKIETEHPGLAMATIDEETHRHMEIPQDMDSTYVYPQAIGTSINEYLMKSSRNAKDKADVLMKLSRFLTRARKDNQTDILKYYHRIATIVENFIREKQQQLPPSNDEPGCTSITELEAAFTQGLSIDSKGQELPLTTVGETGSNVEALKTLMTRLQEIEEYNGLASPKINEQIRSFSKRTFGVTFTSDELRDMGILITKHLQLGSRNAKEKHMSWISLRAFLLSVREDYQRDILEFFQKIATILEEGIIEVLLQPQQQPPSKHRQKKKSQLATMSTDQCQIHPEQQEQQKQRKPRENPAMEKQQRKPSITEALDTLVTRLLKIETEHHGIASRTIDEETISYSKRTFGDSFTYDEQRDMGILITKHLQLGSKNAKEMNMSWICLRACLLTVRKDYQRNILEYFQKIATKLEQQELASTIDGETHSERRQRKKSLLPTMSTDGCQTDQPEQQESTTTIQRVPCEQRWANYRREFKQNCIRVAKLSAGGGFIEDVYIPTRSQWLKMCREEWGTTEEETTAFIKDANARSHQFKIEVCGSHQGYAVIIRDKDRNPVLAISRIAEDYVSPFYHELQGVSLALKLAMKYKIFSFSFYCISEDICQYISYSWGYKLRCDCPPRDDPRNPGKKLNYCVRCSAYTIDDYGEGCNAEKILSLIDEIFCDALALEQQGYPYFDLWVTELCLNAVQHLAKSGLDQEMRMDEIEEDDKLAEILYKEVFGHGTLQELMVQMKK